jgi:hypothetical protein
MVRTYGALLILGLVAGCGEKDAHSDKRAGAQGRRVRSGDAAGVSGGSGTGAAGTTVGKREVLTYGGAVPGDETRTGTAAGGGTGTGGALIRTDAMATCSTAAELGEVRRISTAAELMSLKGPGHFVLGASIDLGDYSGPPVARTENIILDGGGFTISGWKGTGSLFERLECATVRNLTLRGFVVTSNATVGGLAGVAEKVDVRHVTLSSMSLSTSANGGGGVFGYVRSGIFDDIHASDVSVKGTDHGGGFGGLIGSGVEVALTGLGFDAGLVQGWAGVGGIIGNLNNFESRPLERLQVTNTRLNGAGGTGGIVGQIMAEILTSGAVTRPNRSSLTQLDVEDLRIFPHPMIIAANNAGGIAGIVYADGVVSGRVASLELSPSIVALSGSVVGPGHPGCIGEVEVTGSSLDRLGALLGPAQ